MPNSTFSTAAATGRSGSMRTSSTAWSWISSLTDSKYPLQRLRPLRAAVFSGERADEKTGYLGQVLGPAAGGIAPAHNDQGERPPLADALRGGLVLRPALAGRGLFRSHGL